jgi:hypothetical protein
MPPSQPRDVGVHSGATRPARATASFRKPAHLSLLRHGLRKPTLSSPAGQRSTPIIVTSFMDASYYWVLSTSSLWKIVMPVRGEASTWCNRGVSRPETSEVVDGVWPKHQWRTAMDDYIGLNVSMKETAISIRRAGERVWRGKCSSDPSRIAQIVRKHAPNVVRVVFETGPLSVWFYHALKEE